MEGERPRTSSSYAQEGQAAHLLASTAMNNKRPASAYIGRILDVTTEVEVTHDMADHVQTYIDNLKEYAYGADDFLIEQQVDFSCYVDVPDSTGTADAIIMRYANKEIQVHDLKYGMGIRVDADDNEQLMIYALGAYAVHGLLGEFDTVRLVIHQPRLNHVSEWTISISKLLEWAAWMKPKAQWAYGLLSDESLENIEQWLTPGESQCRWCSARPKCPALAKLVHSETVEHFADLDSPDALPADPEEFARKLALVPLIKNWCGAILAKAEADMLNGKHYKGFKVVTGRAGNRAWTDDDGANTVLLTAKLNEDVTHTQPQLKSPAQIEKLVKTKHKESWKQLQDYITQSEGKPTVVPESDKRPSIDVTPTEDHFANLDNEED